MTTSNEARLAELGDRFGALARSVSEVVLGQESVVEEVLVALLTGGHVLLEGVPGVAKTLLARSVAGAIGLDFRRVQFTPDLMPADITGTHVFDFTRGTFHLQRGPVFTSVLLADEINRAPPKTQAALLEAMQERQVTIDGTGHPLPRPFLVLATQNPVEHEGTYPLPEAQLDRFLLQVEMGYPPPEAERRVYEGFLAGRVRLDSGRPDREPVLDGEALLWARAQVDAVRVDSKVIDYTWAVVDGTRSSDRLVLGASPRAGLSLLATARARAALDGRLWVLPDDVKRMAGPVLRHRLVVAPESELEGIDARRVLEGILERVEVRR